MPTNIQKVVMASAALTYNKMFVGDPIGINNIQM